MGSFEYADAFIYSTPCPCEDCAPSFRPAVGTIFAVVLWLVVIGFAVAGC